MLYFQARKMQSMTMITTFSPSRTFEHKIHVFKVVFCYKSPPQYKYIVSIFTVMPSVVGALTFSGTKAICRASHTSKPIKFSVVLSEHYALMLPKVKRPENKLFELLIMDSKNEFLVCKIPRYLPIFYKVIV